MFSSYGHTQITRSFLSSEVEEEASEDGAKAVVRIMSWDNVTSDMRKLRDENAYRIPSRNLDGCRKFMATVSVNELGQNKEG